jgi:hypothetical protein
MRSNPTFDEDYVPTHEERVRMQVDPYGLDPRIRADKRAFLKLDRLWADLMAPVADEIVASLKRTVAEANDPGTRIAAQNDLFDVQQYLERGGIKESAAFWGRVPRSTLLKYGVAAARLIREALSGSLAERTYVRYAAVRILFPGEVIAAPTGLTRPLREATDAVHDAQRHTLTLLPGVPPAARGRHLGDEVAPVAHGLTELLWRAKTVLPYGFGRAYDEAVEIEEESRRSRSFRFRSWFSRYEKALRRAVPANRVAGPFENPYEDRALWALLLEVEGSPGYFLDVWSDEPYTPFKRLLGDQLGRTVELPETDDDSGINFSVSALSRGSPEPDEWLTFYEDSSPSVAQAVAATVEFLKENESSE